MSHIWSSSEIHVKLKLRLYAVSVCSIMKYGAEWRRCLPSAERRQQSDGDQDHSQVTTRRGDPTDTHIWPDKIYSIRSRCLQWLGHIIRMQPNLDGTERLVKSAFRHMFQNPIKGYLFVDAPTIRLHHGENYVCMWADDRGKWTSRLSKLCRWSVGDWCQPPHPVGTTLSQHRLLHCFIINTWYSCTYSLVGPKLDTTQWLIQNNFWVTWSPRRGLLCIMFLSNVIHRNYHYYYIVLFTLLLHCINL